MAIYANHLYTKEAENMVLQNSIKNLQREVKSLKLEVSSLKKSGHFDSADATNTDKGKLVTKCKKEG